MICFSVHYRPTCEISSWKHVQSAKTLSHWNVELDCKTVYLLFSAQVSYGWSQNPTYLHHSNLSTSDHRRLHSVTQLVWRKDKVNITAKQWCGFLQTLWTIEKCISLTNCKCIEKSMLQNYQWDAKSEMQYHQDPQGPLIKTKKWKEGAWWAYPFQKALYLCASGRGL